MRRAVVGAAVTATVAAGIADAEPDARALPTFPSTAIQPEKPKIGGVRLRISRTETVALLGRPTECSSNRKVCRWYRPGAETEEGVVEGAFNSEGLARLTVEAGRDAQGHPAVSGPLAALKTTRGDAGLLSPLAAIETAYPKGRYGAGGSEYYVSSAKKPGWYARFTAGVAEGSPIARISILDGFRP